MRKFLQFGLAGFAGVLALAYAIDTASVMFPGGRRMYEDIQVDQVYTDTNKWNQLEYSRGAPVTVRCVNALFPHGGSQPCWYLRRHTMNVTNTD